MATKIATNQTFKYDPARHGENPEGASLTQPDLAFTIQDLLDRFTRGSMPPIVKQGFFEENPTFDSFDPTRSGAFDLADAVEEKMFLDARIKDRQKQYEEKVKAKQELAKKQQEEYVKWKETQKVEKKEADKTDIKPKEE